MEQVIKSKKTYIKTKTEQSVALKISMLFLIAYYLLPQYLGVQIAGFDLTAQRMAMLLLLIYIMDNRIRMKTFAKLIYSNKVIGFIGIYMLVLAYTMVFRGNVNTFMYSFIEFLCLFLVVYIVSQVYTVEAFVGIVIKFIYLLCILGILEYLMQRSLFSYLITIPGLYTGGMIRSGSYRIMGPANHSLGYGLLLITALPFACMDLKNKTIHVMQNKVLLLLIASNVFLNGSRSTLAVFMLELLILLVLSGKQHRKKTWMYILLFTMLLGLIITVTYSSGFGAYIMMQITSVVDEMLGTQYAVNFGADITTLTNSSNYRAILPKIFTLDWLNPWLGRGSNYKMNASIDGIYIQSIDNFYVAQYIRYAYPGLIAYLIFMFATFGLMLWYGVKYKSGIVIALLVGSVCYFINLWWLDTLQTIKYVYLLFALFYVILYNKSKEKNLHRKKTYFQ